MNNKILKIISKNSVIFKDLVLSCFSYILTSIFIVLVAYIISLLLSSMSSYPLKMRTMGDYSFVILFILNIVFSIVCLYKGKYHIVPNILISDVILVFSFIGIISLLSHQDKPTFHAVKSIIFSTQMIYYTSFVLIGIMFITMCYQIREYIKQNYWYVMLPFGISIILGYKVGIDYVKFIPYLEGSVSKERIAEIATYFKTDINMINELTNVSLFIALMGGIILLGVLIYETIWQKIKK